MDDDYDKPMLSCRPCSEKLPLVLSNEGVHPPIQVPATIVQYLRDYQRDGVRFLYQRYNAAEGGILGDDMGLGKTIQAIAFVAALLQMKGTKEDKLRHCSPYIRNDLAPGIQVPSVSPVLVICPASLTDNWDDEFQIWGYFKVLKINTANRVNILNIAKRKECDVVLITFETARSCIELINMVDWTCILVDEVHRIKDTGSQISKALCSLRCKLRFGFTGTPFQNNMKEVWCLLNWSNPQSMCTLDTFTNSISRAMEQGNRSSATKRHITDNCLAIVRFRELKRKFMLRRTKEILSKHLPSKTDQVVFCELTDIQQSIYQMITRLPDLQKLLGSWKEKCVQKSGALKKRTSLLFTYMHLLQKTANHVGLLTLGLSRGANKVTEQVCRRALEDCAGLQGIPERKWLEALSGVSMSGKMVVLSQLLPVFLERGDKILIFSYSTKVLDFVQKYLIKMRHKFCRLDGNTPSDTRCSLVRSFNSSPDLPIFLLSTKAGGVGLNITGANVVILYDPNWNPAHDMQAQDRAYRLGQQRDVRVYRLLSTSTIEEFVYLRQIYKQQLGSCSMTNKSVRRYFNGISGDPRCYGELFGIRNLFSFREGSRSLTEELLEKQQKLENKLRLKLEAPMMEESTRMRFSKCAILANSDDNIESDNKSGLAQLCEDVFEADCDDPVDEECEEWMHAPNPFNDNEMDHEENMHAPNPFNDNEMDHEENMSQSACISTVLEKSGAVRHVVEHQEVIASSKVEDFVTDCAIRDVLQKGINSQLPAYDCSIETQDEEIPKKCDNGSDSSCSVMSRLKFNQIAREEFLNPLELATKVISMSRREKESLLNKYQKRKQTEISRDAPLAKRARPPSESVSEVISPKKEAFKGVSSNKDTFKQTETSKEVSGKEDPNRSDREIMSPPDNPDVDCNVSSVKDQTDSSDESQKPSSFEMDAISVCPSLTKETISYMEQLICSERKKPAPKQSCGKEKVSGKSTKTIELPNKTTPFNCKLKSGTGKVAVLTQAAKNRQRPVADFHGSTSQHEAIDAESGCTFEALTFLDSFFFSENQRKPSPCKSCPVNFEASTSGLSTGNNTLHSTEELKYCSSDIGLNSMVGESCNEPQYRLEDDVFTKLIENGKLKRL